MNTPAVGRENSKPARRNAKKKPKTSPTSFRFASGVSLDPCCKKWREKIDRIFLKKRRQERIQPTTPVMVIRRVERTAAAGGTEDEE
jgi:hypothetical protein